MKHQDFLKLLIGPTANEGGGGGGGSSPTGTVDIVANGTANVAAYAEAKVAVPGGLSGGIAYPDIPASAIVIESDDFTAHDFGDRLFTAEIGRSTNSSKIKLDVFSTISVGDYVLMYETHNGQDYIVGGTVRSVNQYTTYGRVNIMLTMRALSTEFLTISDSGYADVRGKNLVNFAGGGGGGGGDVNDYAYDYLQAGFTGVLKDGTDPNATQLTNVHQYGLYGASGLTGVDLHHCQVIANYAFYNCPNITKINLPACTSIGQYAFENAIKLINEINLPSLQSISSFALSGSGSSDANAIVKLISLPALKGQAGGFQRWTELRAVRLGSSVTSFANGSFKYCSKLRTLLFGSSLASVPAMSSSSEFGNTLLNSTGGKILVPSALVEDFKAATRWTTFASHIFAIEDIPAWAAGSYAQGDVVTHNGHYYVSIVSSTSQEPSASAADWLDLGAI